MNMNACDKLLKCIDDGILDAKDVLEDILVNQLDTDQANECAKNILIDNDIDDEDEDDTSEDDW